MWWRDDDAYADTPQLRRLDTLSRSLQIPVSIAVIPARLDASLRSFLADRNHISVLQHGYAHQSYAAPGTKKIELGGERSAHQVTTELLQGRDKLSAAFSQQWLDVVVPPWNRIAPIVYQQLARCGFQGVSSMWPRRQRYPASGVEQVNTHIDPVNWRYGGGFLGEQRTLAHLNRHLYARRMGIFDSDEPTGLLTHHLVQDEAVWAFCAGLMGWLKNHPAVQWIGATDIWEQGERSENIDD